MRSKTTQGRKDAFRLEFQFDHFLITYLVAADGSYTVVGYSDNDGNEAIEDHIHFDEMKADLGD